MKALTLWRPWPWAIFRAGKDVENRSWPPPQEVIGERIAIHAGQRWDEDGLHAMWWACKGRPFLPDKRMHLLGIIGTVVVDGARRHKPGCEASPWAFGPYCWLLRDPIELPEPIPCRGAQRLWTMPADVEARVREASGKTFARAPRPRRENRRFGRCRFR